MTGFLILALCVVGRQQSAESPPQSLIAAYSCLAVPRFLFRLILSLD